MWTECFRSTLHFTFHCFPPSLVLGNGIAILPARPILTFLTVSRRLIRKSAFSSTWLVLSRSFSCWKKKSRESSVVKNHISISGDTHRLCCQRSCFLVHAQVYKSTMRCFHLFSIFAYLKDRSLWSIPMRLKMTHLQSVRVAHLDDHSSLIKNEESRASRKLTSRRWTNLLCSMSERLNNKVIRWKKNAYIWRLWAHFRYSVKQTEEWLSDSDVQDIVSINLHVHCRSGI